MQSRKINGGRWDDRAENVCWAMPNEIPAESRKALLKLLALISDFIWEGMDKTKVIAKTGCTESQYCTVNDGYERGQRYRYNYR